MTDPHVARWLRRDRPAYRGIYCSQFEEDLDRYAEIIGELAPPFVVEIGRAEGGTALFLADRLAEAGQDGFVISIDITAPTRRACERTSPVIYLTGSSTDPDVVEAVAVLADARRGVVLLDGDHNPGHVTQELDLYAPLADYLVVEDTIMRHLGNRIGPHQALDVWLPQHPEFSPDPDPVLTQHPGGWLRRTRWQS